MNIESNVLKTVSITSESEQFDLVQYRVTGTPIWHYELVARVAGVDIDELDENTAIEIMGRLFNIHITDDKGICRH